MLFYRAHQLAGNTAFVARAGRRDRSAAGGRALPVYCSSLRTAEPELIETLRQADALVVTVLAAGGSLPAAVGAGGADEDWDVGALAALDVPILQGLCLTSSRAEWAASDDGLTPLDSATQVAIPEFDGRLITVPFSFKEIGADGLIAYVADPERAARVAGIAVNHARLRHMPAGERAHRGDAVGLPDQARPDRQRGRAGHPGLDGAPAGRAAARPATTSASCPASGRRTAMP